jgi:hypothetical protein
MLWTPPLAGSNVTGMPPLTYSPAEAAELSGFSESFLREKARLEEIPHIRGPRQSIRFSPAQLDEVVALFSRPATRQVPRLTTSRARPKKAA